MEFLLSLLPLTVKNVVTARPSILLWTHIQSYPADQESIWQALSDFMEQSKELLQYAFQQHFRIQIGCCKMRTREEANCVVQKFAKPFGMSVRTEIE